MEEFLQGLKDFDAGLPHPDELIEADGNPYYRLGCKHSQKTRKQISDNLKAQGIKPPIQKGKKWWYNGDATTIAFECPGKGWKQGRPSVNQWSPLNRNK